MSDIVPLPDADIEPVRRVPLKEQAYQRIRRLIFRRALPGGASLSEATLAENLGISRTPVREALMQLATEGLVDYSAFSGHRVHSITAAEREEIFVLRRTLELLAVKRLATSVTPAQMAELEAILERQAQYAADNRHSAFLEIDAEFHQKLAEFAGLSVTGTFLTHIRSMFYLMGLEAIGAPGRRHAVVDEHRQIVRAIQAGDPGAAEEALVSHLGMTEHLLAGLSTSSS